MAASRGPVNKKTRLQSREQGGGMGRYCEKHQESLKLFCMEDETVVCLVCDKSRKHRDHEVIPVDEAFEDYKEKINSYLQNLRKERKKILSYEAELEKESRDLLKCTTTEMQKAEEKFRELHQFLLNQIEEVEKEIAGRRDEQLAKLSRQLSSLDSIIQEMEEKSQQPASELLQDVRSSLQRCERTERPENPLAFTPELKEKASRFRDMNLRLEKVMKEFKDAMLFRQQLQKANVTLDPDTAHPCLILSKDRKSVRLADIKQDVPDNPERFNNRHCVLGREEFTAGRHFWEVTVGSEGEWAVGIARKSMGRKGRFPFSPEGGLWALDKMRNGYWACTSPEYSPLSLREKPKRIRVTLDYEGGCVSFSDADSGAELYTFSGASFSGETLLPFFRLWGNETHLRIS
ncbi:E3 ubiquitin-protein ligase TRIM7-like [Zootoca vivipara]|uniref:E3 ubiquitin-protein ligase TRIM7-like n=1 Tax=Zootoca vivipara TaxID=8524 RepID=UPI00158FFB50|nr:E3 ubiquitin-protein ligase TRIM7-like [Zootoca vivipara]